MAGLARIVDVPWQLAKAADRPFLTSAGTSRHNGTLLDRYVERVLIAATHDPAAGRALLRVSGNSSTRHKSCYDPTSSGAHSDPHQLPLPHIGQLEPPADADPINARNQSPWWLFGVIGAAALLNRSW